MPTNTLEENQSNPQGNAQKSEARRGFSSAEKWVIWAVFCLLVGLSTHWLAFPALMLISWSVARFRWYVGKGTVWWQRWPAFVVFLVGVGMIAWAAV